MVKTKSIFGNEKYRESNFFLLFLILGGIFFIISLITLMVVIYHYGEMKPFGELSDSQNSKDHLRSDLRLVLLIGGLIFGCVVILIGVDDPDADW